MAKGKNSIATDSKGAQTLHLADSELKLLYVQILDEKYV